jgi:hypothetical protein
MSKNIRNFFTDHSSTNKLTSTDQSKNVSTDATKATIPFIRINGNQPFDPIVVKGPG